MHVKGLCVTVVRLLSLSEALAVYFLLMLKSVFFIKEQPPPPREWVSVTPQTVTLYILLMFTSAARAVM